MGGSPDTLRPWTIRELKELTKLTTEYAFSATLIASLQLIPNRSVYAISKMMGRHSLGNPTIMKCARQACRLNKEQRQEFQRFLLDEGRWLPSSQVAEKWGVAQKTVTAYRRRLGTQLSWRQARDSQGYRGSQASRARDFIAWTRERWRRWRQQREKTLERRKQEIAQYADPPAVRICAACGQHWFATNEFYYVRRRLVGKRLKVTISQTCRLCRSQQRRLRRLGTAEQQLVA